MNPDRNKLVFYTGDPIDKIVADKVTRTIVNDGNTGGSMNWQQSKIVTQDFPNPYGKQCFVRGRWNIDGGAWNTFESHLSYTFTIILTNPSQPSQGGAGLLAAVSIGVHADFVRIVTANGHHRNVTVNIGTGAQSYSSIGHTFNIEYELFEVE